MLTFLTVLFRSVTSVLNPLLPLLPLLSPWLFLRPLRLFLALPSNFLVVISLDFSSSSADLFEMTLGVPQESKTPLEICHPCPCSSMMASEILTPREETEASTLKGPERRSRRPNRVSGKEHY